MVPQAVPDQQGSQAAGKGDWAPRIELWETDVKYLRNLFRLTDQKLVPVNFRLCPMHLIYTRRHQTRGQFHSKVWKGDLYSKPFMVR